MIMVKINFASLSKYLQSLLSYAVLPIAALFLVAIFWKTGNAHGAIATIVVGFISGVVLFIISEFTSLMNFHFLYIALILFLISIPVITIVSLMTPPPAEEKTEGLIWTKRFLNAESKLLQDMPWNKNYRIQSIILVILTLAAVIWWL